MKLTKVPPIDLISSNVDEGTYDGSAVPEYGSGPYAKGDKVRITDTFPQMVYESKIDSNSVVPVARATTDEWIWLGVTDRGAMFDFFSNTQTKAGPELAVVLNANFTNCVGLFNLVGHEVELTLATGDEIIQSETINLLRASGSNWWEYLFGPFEYRRGLVWYYPHYSNAQLNVTIRGNDTSGARCGVCGLGKAKYLAGIERGSAVSIKSKSRVKEDAFGITELIKRPASKETVLNIKANERWTDIIYWALEDIDGCPAIFDANADETNFETLITYGILRGAGMSVQTEKLRTTGRITTERIA